MNRFNLLFIVLLVFGMLHAEGAVGGDLTRTQLKILDMPPRPSPYVGFSFDNPRGPVFGEEEIKAQFEAGKTIVPMIARAFSNGSDCVRIPPGNYRFGKSGWGKAGPAYSLELAGLQRDADHTFTIDATGVTFWFDFGDSQAPHAMFSVGFRNCSNVVFKGATLDRGSRGNIEGRITQIDYPGNRIEIQVCPGVRVPDSFNQKLEQRIVPFKSDGRFCAPLYVLQGGGEHLKYKNITPGTAADRFFVNMCDTALLDLIRDAGWGKAYGDLGVLREGDGISCVYTVSSGVELVGCGNMTMEGLSVYIAKGWGAEWGGFGAHLWKNCYFGPRPGTSQWQGGEGFMFCATRHGTTLDGVTICHTTDDIANFHGYWGHIRNSEGNRVTFEPSGEFNRTVLRDMMPGDNLVCYDRDSGAMIGTSVVSSVNGYTVTLEGPVVCLTNAVAEMPEHQCAGWTVQNCTFHDNYQRLLIQSGPGTVRNCKFVRQGSSIELNSVIPYVEGSVPHGIVISGNTFVDVNPRPGGESVNVHYKTCRRNQARNISRIEISGNTFENPGEVAVDLAGVSKSVISGNWIVNPVRYTATARPGAKMRRQAISLTRCTGITVAGNSIIDPGNFTEKHALTGSNAAGIDSSCLEILVDGKLINPTQ
jgi:hypothetical protein